MAREREREREREGEKKKEEDIGIAGRMKLGLRHLTKRNGAKPLFYSLVK